MKPGHYSFWMKNIDELQYPYELRWLPLLYTKHSEQKDPDKSGLQYQTVDQHRRNYKRIFNKIKYFHRKLHL